MPQSPARRFAARIFLRVQSPAAIALALATVSARAVVVRGIVTDPLGATVPGARVQLLQGRNTGTLAISGPDGAFEIRSGDSGRFVLLTSAAGFALNIGTDFYGGKTDIISQDVVLSLAEIRQEVTVTATGLLTPLPQLTAPVSLISRDDLLTRIGIVEDLRQAPGNFVVQTGQTGSQTSLFVRGGNSDSNKVLIDGIPAEDVGGLFDWGTISSTGLAASPRTPSPGNAAELYRGPNSALYGTDALASVVSLSTPRGATTHPAFNYSGDAGNLHTWRDEAILSGTHKKLDYLAAYSRFDTSNALPLDRYHSSTSAANIGYAITGDTLFRFTIRNADSATGLPNARDLYGLSQNGKQSDQDLYSGATLENTTLGGWHNLVRYGIARKREQAAYFGSSGTLLTLPNPFFPGPDQSPTFSGYFGNVVTIRGANGYTATGQAQIYGGANRDQDSNRDELYYQSDYTTRYNLAVLFGFRYENERGSFNLPAYSEFEQIQRTNFQFNLQLQGALGSRLFYSFGGGLEKNHLYGLAGTPRLGLAFIPVRPSRRLFHGTRLRINAATGVQEPNLATEFSSLYRTLLALGDTADIASYHVEPLGPQRSRTFETGIDQNIIGEKLILKAGYFHNQFSHQLEFVGAYDLQQDFGFTPGSAFADAFTNFYGGAELNSEAFRAQGLETELQYQPLSRLFVRAGYTYLASLVEQSFASDATAAAGGFPNTNPNLPGIAIGSSSPLVGARPFRRPPHTAFFAVQYTGQKWTAALKGVAASRSDDSTFLGYADTAEGNSLLLPNHNLDFSYTKLDLYGTYAATGHIVVFTELDNLLNNQHIGPIGYPALPLTVRAGLKIRLSRE